MGCSVWVGVECNLLCIPAMHTCYLLCIPASSSYYELVEYRLRSEEKKVLKKNTELSL